MGTDRVDRLKREIAGLCNQALDIPTFFDRARQAIGRSMPHDGCCWMTFDPATLLPTSHIPYRSIPPEQVARLAQNEYAEEDVNKFAALWRRTPNVGNLSAATNGVRDQSIRYRVLLEPNGFENELRGVFSHDAACWGGAAFYRSNDMPDFTIEEALSLASISELMADGIRRAALTQAVAIVDPIDAPGLILVDAEGEVEAMNPPAKAWLDELLVTAERPTELPSTIHALVERTRHSAGVSQPIPTQVRARTRSGQWVVIHGSLVEGVADGRVAVIFEQARAPQLAPLIAAAYGLTARERDIAALVIQGLSTKEIADQLSLSPHTVQDHLKATFNKVGVRSRRELVTQVFSEQYAPRMGASIPVGADGWFVNQ